MRAGSETLLPVTVRFSCSAFLGERFYYIIMIVPEALGTVAPRTHRARDSLKGRRAEIRGEMGKERGRGRGRQWQKEGDRGGRRRTEVRCRRSTPTEGQGLDAGNMHRVLDDRAQGDTKNFVDRK